MFKRLKNKTFNIKNFLKYSKDKNISIAKQVKCFELGELDFDKKARVIIEEGLILKKNVSIKCRDNARLHIGKNVYFNNNCILVCRKRIRIGDDVSFGPNVAIFDHDHDYKAADRKHTFITGDIVIGNDTWVGAHATILKGAKIGKNCVIAAGAIVNCEVPNNTVFINKHKMKKI